MHLYLCHLKKKTNKLTNKYSELLLSRITEIKNKRYTLVKRKKQSKNKNQILSCDESLYHFQTRTTIVIKMEKINTVGDFSSSTWYEIMKIRNLLYFPFSGCHMESNKKVQNCLEFSSRRIKRASYLLKIGSLFVKNIRILFNTFSQTGKC